MKKYFNLNRLFPQTVLLSALNKYIQSQNQIKVTLNDKLSNYEKLSCIFDSHMLMMVFPHFKEIVRFMFEVSIVYSILCQVVVVCSLIHCRSTIHLSLSANDVHAAVYTFLFGFKSKIIKTT